VQSLGRHQLTIHIDAPPEVVYSLVSDVTRTPEFSPEVLRCTWLDGATGPVVGARFKAVNKVPRRPPWNTRPVITVARPRREFAISRTERFSGTLVWRYQLEPDGRGTRVLESYEVTQPVTRLG
jgi:Polyketide cyclase / dehydrase and lipid transport